MSKKRTIAQNKNTSVALVLSEWVTGARRTSCRPETDHSGGSSPKRMGDRSEKKRAIAQKQSIPVTPVPSGWVTEVRRTSYRPETEYPSDSSLKRVGDRSEKNKPLPRARIPQSKHHPEQEK